MSEESITEVLSGHVVLGQATDGRPQDSAAQILEVLYYAATGGGAPLQAGTLPGNVVVPWSDQTCLTCAQAVVNMLRWTPDAAAWFDYSTNPPVLHIHRRATAPVVALAVHDGARVTGNVLTPRHDLLLPCVALLYEWGGATGDTGVDADVCPPGANLAQPGAAVLTISLRPESAAYAEYHCDYAEINAADPAWWLQKGALPEGAAGITLKEVKKSAAVNRELVGGAFPPGYPNAVREATISCLASYTLFNEAGAGTAYTDVPLRLTINGTDEVQQDWRLLTSYTAPEPRPADLAAKIYESVSELQYDGELTLTEHECDPAAWHPGQLLNLTGGRPEWATARAQVQAVTFDLDSGVTVLTLGPTPWLAATDLVELLRAARERNSTNYFAVRVNGGAGAARGRDGGLTANRTATTSEAFVSRRVMAGGEHDAYKLTFDATAGLIELRVNNETTPKVISINLEDLAAADVQSNNILVKLRPVQLCEGRVAKEAYVLMSEPVEV
jgi:hypothetical protein